MLSGLTAALGFGGRRAEEEAEGKKTAADADAAGGSTKPAVSPFLTGAANRDSYTSGVSSDSTTPPFGAGSSGEGDRHMLGSLPPGRPRLVFQAASDPLVAGTSSSSGGLSGAAEVCWCVVCACAVCVVCVCVCLQWRSRRVDRLVAVVALCCRRVGGRAGGQRWAVGAKSPSALV